MLVIPSNPPSVVCAEHNYIRAYRVEGRKQRGKCLDTYVHYYKVQTPRGTFDRKHLIDVPCNTYPDCQAMPR